MKKLFIFLAFVAISMLSYGQDNQLVWANGHLLYGSPVANIDSLTYDEMQDIDTLYLLIPRTLVKHDTIYVTNGGDVNNANGCIQGTITDETTGGAIAQANIELFPNGLKTITDTKGNFEFTKLEAGSYVIRVTKEGYADVVSNAIDVVDNQSTNVTVQMKSSTPLLEVVNDNNQKIDSLYFGKEDYDILLSISIWNSGSSSLEWAVICPAPWIQSISKESGVLAANSKQSVTITIDREKLNNGENTSVLYITSNGGNKTLKIIAIEENYNKLPTFVFEGSTYRVLPTLEQKHSFSGAKSACSSITYDGYTTWVVPTIEMYQIMYTSAVPGSYTDDDYWSSTTKKVNDYSNTYYYHYDFYDGSVNSVPDYQTSLEFYVRCVRRED